MAEVNADLTRKVADLARLELSETEVRDFTRQLGDILKYIEQLSEVDVKGVQPMIHPIPITLRLREDVVEPTPVDAHGKPKVLASAPEVVYDGYKVPPIL